MALLVASSQLCGEDYNLQNSFSERNKGSAFADFYFNSLLIRPHEKLPTFQKKHVTKRSKSKVSLQKKKVVVATDCCHIMVMFLFFK